MKTKRISDRISQKSKFKLEDWYWSIVILRSLFLIKYVKYESVFLFFVWRHFLEFGPASLRFGIFIHVWFWSLYLLMLFVEWTFFFTFFYLLPNDAAFSIPIFSFILNGTLINVRFDCTSIFVMIFWKDNRMGSFNFSGGILDFIFKLFFWAIAIFILR